MEAFHFLRPWWLTLFLPCFFLIWLLWKKEHGKKLWADVISEDLMPYLLVRDSKDGKRNSRKLPLFLFFLLTPLILALGGPSWNEASEPLVEAKSGLVIALDLSNTMDAQDIKPSRLKRALYKIQDLLNLRQEGDTALLVYSKNPFVVTPLTHDKETIKALLPVLETTMIPDHGQGASLAILKASDLLEKGGFGNQNVLLVTADLSDEEKNLALAAAKKKGIRVSILAVGTDEQAPISKPQGGFLSDKDGKLVVSRLTKNNLVQLTAETDGTYVPISVDDSDIQELANRLFFLGELNEEDNASQVSWQDQGYLFVLLALPFAALLFRQGMLFCLLLILPCPLKSLEWNELWKTKEQEAYILYEQEMYEEALEKFDDPKWRAAVHYRLQNYDAAIDALKEAKDTESLYNLATAKAKRGDLKEALEDYKQVLSLQADHEDALYNKKIIEDALEKENPETKNESEKENSDPREDKDKQNQNSDQNNKKEQNENSDPDEKKDRSPQNSESSPESKEEDPKKNENENKQQESQVDNSNKTDQNSNKEEKTEGQAASQKDISQETKAEDEKQIAQNDTKEVRPQENKPENASQKEEEKEMPVSEADKQKQIDERWLNRIPDDPGGLLRRKFLYQYQQQRP